MTAANKLKSEAAEKMQQYEAALRNARSRGLRRGLLERERSVMVQEKELKVRMAKEEVNKATTATLEQLHQQESNVKSELETQAAGIGDSDKFADLAAQALSFI